MSKHGPHELSFRERYIFSVDHKVIGLQYMMTSMVFLLVGFGLMMLMRWQLAFPGRAIPFFGHLFSPELAPNGVMSGEFYNALGAMHGTIMVFLGVVGHVRNPPRGSRAWRRRAGS